MNILDILKKAEENLREAIAEAARAGNYRDVDLGRSVAVGVQELCERITGHRKAPAKSVGDDTERGERKRHKRITKRNKPPGLPRFEVRNSSLFKIGWSRKQMREYEHKVPRAAFDAIVNTMARLAKAGNGPFTAELILEKLNNTKEETIPAYQVYVVIAALRVWNLINQVGREGYNIPADVSEIVAFKWSELSNKN